MNHVADTADTAREALADSANPLVDKVPWQAGWNDRVCYIRALKPAQ